MTMVSRLLGVAVSAVLLCVSAPAHAQTCTQTGFYRDGINMTAALINPSGTFTGTLDATGCNIGIYYDNGVGAIETAEIFGANYFGVFVNGDANDVAVTVQDSVVHNIGEVPFNGTQHGVAIYFRSFGAGSASGSVTGTEVSRYQKGGVVANGNSNVSVSGCTVTGLGPVGFIAQNGIQFGFGAKGSAMRNAVSANSYTGTSAASAGILVYGDATGLTTGIQIVGNVLAGNDNGVTAVNYDSDYNPPATATNIKIVNNTISGAGAGPNPYLAGVSDYGNNDKIVNNKIADYETAVDTSGSVKAKVHATK